MRFVLVLLAVIGLLAGPTAAAAAQSTCHEQAGGAMSGMSPMASMTHAGGQTAAPCCDPRSDHGPGKHDERSCLQACAVMCGVVAALPSWPMTLARRPDHSAPEPARLATLKAHAPDRLERPPRSIA